jgi:pimeloyl-ACP methyl ester carboxylesterase
MELGTEYGQALEQLGRSGRARRDNRVPELAHSGGKTEHSLSTKWSGNWASSDAMIAGMTKPQVSDNRAQLLLIHGGFHGSWVWQKLIYRLGPLGLRVRTVELPSVAAKGELRYGMLDDAAEVRRRLKAINGPVVAVAHSYGGMVITEAAVGLANVSHIIYLAAFQLDIGDSLLGTVEEAPPWWIVDGDTLTADRPLETFYADVPPDHAALAIARLQPSSYATVTERLTGAAWRNIPSTYVICERDHALPLSAQEQMAKRATNIRRLQSSHSPMLSQPAEVAQIIAAIASPVQC